MLKRPVINFVLAVAGGLSCISGLIIFLHMRSLLTKQVHKWSSLIFIAFLVLHVIVNWKPLLGSLKGSATRAVVLAILAVGTIGMILASTMF